MDILLEVSCRRWPADGGLPLAGHGSQNSEFRIVFDLYDLFASQIYCYFLIQKCRKIGKHFLKKNSYQSPNPVSRHIIENLAL